MVATTWSRPVTSVRRSDRLSPLPPRRAPPLLKGHSVGLFEFGPGLVDLAICVGHQAAVVIASPLRASDS